jgi:hypothetical protein
LESLLLESQVSIGCDNLTLVDSNQILLFDLSNDLLALSLDIFFSLLLALSESILKLLLGGLLLELSGVDNCVTLLLLVTHESLQLRLEVFVILTTHVFLLDFSLLCFKIAFLFLFKVDSELAFLLLLEFI